jgi:hypothetical protein
MAPKKKKTRKKTVGKKSATKKKTAKKKLVNRKKKVAQTSTRRPQRTGRSEYAVRRSRRTIAAGEQSGDLQGLSRHERADSESVDELLQEGNAFEAGVVEGVEDAEARSERGVHTREVPEDDVPGEYLDRDE